MAATASTNATATTSTSSLTSSYSPSSSSVLLTDSILSNFRCGRVFTENSAPINSISYNSSGDYLVTSSDDESINLYSLNSGLNKKQLFSKRYGCCLVRFTHHLSTILTSSTSDYDYSIKYLSLHDNKYLRYFKGHSARVSSISMSPSEDLFLTSSKDKTVKLWDLRVSTAQGSIKGLNSTCLVSFDTEGIIFAVAGPFNQVKLYDKRSFDKGPFGSFTLEMGNNNSGSNSNNGTNNNTNNSNKNNEAFEWSSIKFSPDGKYLLLSTLDGKLLLIDSFSGSLIQSYVGIVNKSNLVLEPSFSPDSQFVVSGSETGLIHIFNTINGEEKAVWSGHSGPVGCVNWAPDRLCIATACKKLALWIPKLE